MTVLCENCGVEAADPLPEVCPICADEREFLPADGVQRWVELDELRRLGHRTELNQFEPDLWGLVTTPKIGIGHTGLLVRTPQGVVLWDPPGFVDEGIAAEIRGQGPIIAVVPSHPHMYGLQLEWAAALGGVPVVLAEADRQWVQRTGDALDFFTDHRELAPGLAVHRFGGHFAGSSVLEWSAGAEGRGALLVADTVMVNPDRKSVSFMRSYPNRIPLSGATARRLADRVAELRADRAYSNFGNVLDADLQQAVRRSADRHAAWCAGEYDEGD